MIFRVNINKWLRGNDNGQLLTSDGLMCCLGFAERQCGARLKDIRGLNNPSNVALDKQPKAVIGVLITELGADTRFSQDAIGINDDEEITDTERMKKLRALAKQYGHRFVFVRDK